VIPPFLKSPKGQDPVVVEGVFRTSCERLFQAWTNADDVLQWFGPGDPGLETAKIDLKTGGIWEFAYAERDGKTDTLSGEYVEITPNERLIFTWTHRRRDRHGQSETTHPSLVTVEFEDIGDSVRMRLTHENIRSEDGRLGVTDGWSATFQRLGQLIKR